MGAYHTLDLELNRKFTLQKALWDSIALERVEMACDPAANADVAAVVMQEGLAHVCLITPSMTLVRSKIDITIPRKRKGFVQQHEKVNICWFKNVHGFYPNALFFITAILHQACCYQLVGCLSELLP